MANDTTVIDLLYDLLEQQPKNLYVWERIIEAWEARNERGKPKAEFGKSRDERIYVLNEPGRHTGNAREAASALLQLDPNNTVATRCLSQARQSAKPARRSAAKQETSKPREPEPPRPNVVSDKSTKHASLPDGYRQLMLEARHLEEEISATLRLASLRPNDKCQQSIDDLKKIGRGEVGAAIQHLQPVSARETARAVAATRSKEKTQGLLVADLEAAVAWALSQSPPLALDAIRDRLVKRRTLLEAALPEALSRATTDALAVVERKHLKKKYANSETMLGDPVKDIPAARFFVSEDNYAWDMEELAQALAVNDGVMRNPLSKQMFSETDIRTVLAHPLGARLKPMQLAQDRLKKGVRPDTIAKLDALGKVLLADQTEDAAPSRGATDEFLAYVATLPAHEQKTLDELKIPARDSLNGQPYDCAVGQSVKDAKSNLTCFHKVRVLSSPADATPSRASEPFLLTSGTRLATSCARRRRISESSRRRT